MLTMSACCRLARGGPVGVVRESVDVEAAEAAASGLVRRGLEVVVEAQPPAQEVTRPEHAARAPDGCGLADQHLRVGARRIAQGRQRRGNHLAGRCAGRPRWASGRSGGWARSRARTTPPSAAPRSRPSSACRPPPRSGELARVGLAVAGRRSRAAHRRPSPTAARRGPSVERSRASPCRWRAAPGRRTGRSRGTRSGSVASKRGPAREFGRGATSLHFIAEPQRVRAEAAHAPRASAPAVARRSGSAACGPRRSTTARATEGSSGRRHRRPRSRPRRRRPGSPARRCAPRQASREDGRLRGAARAEQLAGRVVRPEAVAARLLALDAEVAVRVGLDARAGVAAALALELDGALPGARAHAAPDRHAAAPRFFTTIGKLVRGVGGLLLAAR